MSNRFVARAACLSAAASVLLALGAANASAGELARDLKNPESAAIAPDGTIYVTTIGEFDKDGDGQVLAFAPGKPMKVFAAGLNDPKGIVVHKDALYVTDKTRLVKIDKEGKVSVALEADKFDPKPTFLNDIDVDREGSFVITDSGDDKGVGAAVYGVLLDAGFVTGGIAILDPKISPLVKRPNGALFDKKKDALWIVDFESGDLLRMPMAEEGSKPEKIAGGFPGGDGLALDDDGNLYISSWKTGELWKLPAGKTEAVVIAKDFKSAADICIDRKGNRLIVPDMKAGTLHEVLLEKK